MSLILTKITLDQKYIQDINSLATYLGVKNIIRKTTEQKCAGVVNKLALASRDAYKSKVPVDTFELRDKYIRVLKRATPTSLTAHVGILDGIHKGRGRTKSSIELALMLNTGKGEYEQPLHRTRQSAAIEPYSPIAFRAPTKNWISSGRTAFQNVKRSILLSGIV